MTATSSSSKSKAILMLGSDDENSDWQPPSTPSPKCKLFTSKGKGTSDRSPKRKCLDPPKKELTSIVVRRQTLPIAQNDWPSLNFTRYRYEQESASQAQETPVRTPPTLSSKWTAPKISSSPKATKASPKVMRACSPKIKVSKAKAVRASQKWYVFRLRLHSKS